MGNYIRLNNGEFLPGDPTPEDTELEVKLQAEADYYFAELVEWVEAVKAEGKAT